MTCLRALPRLSLISALLLYGTSASAGESAPASAVAPPAPPPPAPPTASAPVPASVPHPHAYGILVGSNVGGAGQAELRYAEDDARRMAQVLRELGRYGTADMQVLVRPDSARVLAAVDDVAAKLREDQARGEQAVLVFYYSGHAKANAFNLGADELSVAVLRDKLKHLPTTLTLVVLDACQSGQFARVKGAEPAADFSFNSVSRLTTKGTAVIASSSAQELSQESDELRSSYFTHHLIVALRGAADADGDGRVSLDEAYRYAYRHTLVATSKTQVGGQHVTLDTDLAGQGEVPVTYPADARSQLELPASLEARVLLEHTASGNVVAEVQKAPGSAVKLALPAGAYQAIVRRAAAPRIVQCPLALADTKIATIDLGACTPVKLAGTGKGFSDGDDGDDAPKIDTPDRIERGWASRPDPWQVEAGIGVIWRQDDDYTSRLNEFGYERTKKLFRPPHARLHAGFSKGVTPHLSVGAYAQTLSGDAFQRTLSDSNDSFTWDTYALSAFLRASLFPVGTRQPKSPFVELYAQLAGGVSLATSTLVTGSSRPGTTSETTTDTQWGYVIGAHAGAAFGTKGPLVLFVQGGYERAPTLANLLGETHDSGGPSVQIGARLRFE